MQTWNVLDVGSVWMKEFTSALQKQVPLNAWQPQMESLGALQSWQSSRTLVDPCLQISLFPLQRGYARFPFRTLLPFQHRLLRRLLAKTPEPSSSPLICSTPFYAALAELWPGPVVYYVTDLTVAYPTVNADQVVALDRRLCRIARAVCPNSRRIADYLAGDADCDSSKIVIVPNATRESNILPEPFTKAGPRPLDIADLERPIVGVMGDLSTNLDWVLLQQAIEQTADLHWVFVGSTERAIPNAAQSRAREKVKTLARFVGRKPYGELQSYARSLDVAVLPYLKSEPTYSGSSTRFYEHLAAGRPIISTRGFAELLSKEPLLRLIDTADELVSTLRALQQSGFRDGHETERWQASRDGTWEKRVFAVREAVGRDHSGLQEVTMPSTLLHDLAVQ